MPETPSTSKLNGLLSSLPTGALQTWGQVEFLIKNSAKPIFILLVEDKRGGLLQFQTPKQTMKVVGNVITYFTGETVAGKDFFNRHSAPTFFIFDNYLHAYALEQKLVAFGLPFVKQKFK